MNHHHALPTSAAGVPASGPRTAARRVCGQPRTATSRRPFELAEWEERPFSYFIGPTDLVGWHWDVDDLRRRITRRWPGAYEVTWPAPLRPLTPLEMTVPTAEAPGYWRITLDHDFQYVILQAPQQPSRCTEFGVWYLTQLPTLDPAIHVGQLDDWPSRTVALRRDTTAAHLNDLLAQHHHGPAPLLRGPTVYACPPCGHHNQPRTLSTPNDVRTFVDDLAAHPAPCATLDLYNPGRLTIDGFPDHLLRVTLDPRTRRGALTYLGHDPHGRDALWVSRPDTGSPGGAATRSGRTPTLPVPLLTVALTQFVESGGERPRSVDWRNDTPTRPAVREAASMPAGPTTAPIEQYARTAIAAAVNGDRQAMVRAFAAMIGTEQASDSLALVLAVCGELVNDLYPAGPTDEGLGALACEVAAGAPSWATLDESTVACLLDATAAGDGTLGGLSIEALVNTAFIAVAQVLIAHCGNRTWTRYLDDLLSRVIIRRRPTCLGTRRLAPANQSRPQGDGPA